MASSRRCQRLRMPGGEEIDGDVAALQLAPRQQQGDTQIASPTCTSSKSPWIGCMPSERGTMLATDISAMAVSSDTAEQRRAGGEHMDGLCSEFRAVGSDTRSAGHDARRSIGSSPEARLHTWAQWIAPGADACRSHGLLDRSERSACAISDIGVAAAGRLRVLSILPAFQRDAAVLHRSSVTPSSVASARPPISATVNRL